MVSALVTHHEDRPSIAIAGCGVFSTGPESTNHQMWTIHPQDHKGGEGHLLCFQNRKGDPALHHYIQGHRRVHEG